MSSFGVLWGVEEGIMRNDGLMVLMQVPTLEVSYLPDGYLSIRT